MSASGDCEFGRARPVLLSSLSLIEDRAGAVGDMLREAPLGVEPLLVLNQLRRDIKAFELLVLRARLACLADSRQGTDALRQAIAELDDILVRSRRLESRSATRMERA